VHGRSLDDIAALVARQIMPRGFEYDNAVRVDGGEQPAPVACLQEDGEAEPDRSAEFQKRDVCTALRCVCTEISRRVASILNSLEAGSPGQPDSRGRVSPRSSPL
jgi:hypothetical protein